MSSKKEKFMYYCNNYENKFEKPKRTFETHGLSSPPFEVFYLCPFCDSTNFKEVETKYCRCCGARIKNSATGYCSTECKKTGEKLRLAEYKKTKQLAESPLIMLIREVDNYNKIHKTKYSYGQYVALIKPRIKVKK